MTGTELISLRLKHVYTRAELARELGVDSTTILRWEKGQRRIPAWVPKFLECLHGEKGGR
jgi:DNA-binding XRE family transcriptional regulator